MNSFSWLTRSLGVVATVLAILCTIPIAGHTDDIAFVNVDPAGVIGLTEHCALDGLRAAHAGEVFVGRARRDRLAPDSIGGISWGVASTHLCSSALTSVER
jgi:hypothetical protein